MSHYASSLCFLKIKHHLVNDLQNALESYRSPLASDEYYNLCCDTDDEHNTDEMEAVYKACEDFADWSNYVEDCIPPHLRELFKGDE